MSTNMNEVTARRAALRKHLSMLNAAQARLGATARIVNAGRITAAREELESVEAFISIVERDGGVYGDDGEFTVLA